MIANEELVSSEKSERLKPLNHADKEDVDTIRIKIYNGDILKLQTFVTILLLP